ncbi:hypothetical protein ACE7GA_20980 [Roseomonas sp. CCTCC AB2023176]|uniref:hypothetical protein n=1 Tax=Roseomonas sp. CCTCC AB2023176 TaxID=3342640 RepID=UPI0035D7313A
MRLTARALSIAVPAVLGAAVLFAARGPATRLGGTALRLAAFGAVVALARPAPRDRVPPP